MLNPFDEINNHLQEIKGLLQELIKNNSPSVQLSKPVTQKELAKFLNCTEATVINMRRRKEIPFYLVGNSPRFDIEKVIKALENER